MHILNIRCEVEVLAWDEIPAKVRNLIEMAKVSSANAYAPYSKFLVGAAVLLSNGEIVLGNNQENVAYPSGLCAERTALFSANANFPTSSVQALVIAAQTNGAFLPTPITPCGACRQVMLETEQRFKNKIEIYLYGTEKIYHLKGADALLPLQFEM